MGLDAATVLKRSVLCPHCNEDYYFTLRAIADHPELRCHGCGGSIYLLDKIFEPLLSDVRAVLEAIHSAQSARSFISAHPTVAVYR
jgi:transcription elongation factor Elf1